MQNQNLIQVVNRALPSLSGSSISFDAGRNFFCTSSYTSAAGNSYYQGIRLSDRLIMNLDLGQGYWYLFVNGIKLYCFDGQNKKLIASKSYSCQCYSDYFVRKECENLLFDYLRTQSRFIGSSISDHQLEDFSKKMVSETMCNQYNAIC